MVGQAKEMTDEQKSILERGRKIVADLDMQFLRMTKLLELETDGRPIRNIAEETQLARLLRSFTEWAKIARDMGIDPEKEFPGRLQQVREIINATLKPMVKDPLMDAWLRGDLREEGPKEPKKPPSRMPLEDWPP